MCVWQQNNKLIAADSSNDIFLAARPGENVGRFFNQSVSGCMAEYIIGQFQAVDVGKDG